MLNKLKFRVWCHRIKHFTNVPFLDSTGRQLLWLHAGNKIEITNLDDESEYAVQFSYGVLDKNNEEIFEGDFIQYTHFNQKGYINTIVKVPPIICFHWFNNLQEMSLMENSCDIKVIGNIFQNPELKVLCRK